MTILKNIPQSVPPALLYALARMGHGDEIVIADANFPAESVAACTAGGIVRCDGLTGPQMLEAVLQVGMAKEGCGAIGVGSVGLRAAVS